MSSVRLIDFQSARKHTRPIEAGIFSIWVYLSIFRVAVNMQKRVLGKDLTVSAIGLGCMGMTHAYGAPSDENDMLRLMIFRMTGRL